MKSLQPRQQSVGRGHMPPPVAQMQEHYEMCICGHSEWTASGHYPITPAAASLLIFSAIPGFLSAFMADVGLSLKSRSVCCTVGSARIAWISGSAISTSNAGCFFSAATNDALSAGAGASACVARVPTNAPPATD